MSDQQHNPFYVKPKVEDYKTYAHYEIFDIQIGDNSNEFYDKALFKILSSWSNNDYAKGLFKYYGENLLSTKGKIKVVFNQSTDGANYNPITNIIHLNTNYLTQTRSIVVDEFGVLHMKRFSLERFFMHEFAHALGFSGREQLGQNTAPYWGTDSFINYFRSNDSDQSKAFYEAMATSLTNGFMVSRGEIPRIGHFGVNSVDSQGRGILPDAVYDSYANAEVGNNNDLRFDMRNFVKESEADEANILPNVVVLDPASNVELTSEFTGIELPSGGIDVQIEFALSKAEKYLKRVRALAAYLNFGEISLEYYTLALMGLEQSFSNTQGDSTELDYGEFLSLLGGEDELALYNDAIVERDESGQITKFIFVRGDGEKLEIDLLDPPAPIFGAVGRAIGSSIGNFIESGNEFVDRAASVVLSTIALNVGQALDEAIEGAVSPTRIKIDATGKVEASGNEVWEDFGADLSETAQGALVGFVSSYLSAELIDSVGIGGELGALVDVGLSSVLGEGISAVTGIGDGIEGLSGSIFDGKNVGEALKGADFGAALFNALGAYLGTRLAQQIVTPNTQAAVILSSVGSSVGGVLGGFILGKELGALGWAAGPVGALVGAFAGYVIGTLFGNLFGAKLNQVPTANAEVLLSNNSGYFVVGQVSSENGGNEELVREIAETSKGTLNRLISLLTYDSEIVNHADYQSPSQKYGLTGGQMWVEISGVRHDIDSVDEAVDYGALKAIRQTEIIGGNLYLKRVIANSQANSLVGLSADLQIGEDYENYLYQREFINKSIAESHDNLSEAQKQFYRDNESRFTRVLAKDAIPLSSSGQSEYGGESDLDWYNANQATIDAIIESVNLTAFVAGWLVTLQRVSELGLNKTSKSDFYGGLAGLADSLKISNDANTNFHLEDIVLSKSMDNDGTLNVLKDENGDGIAGAGDSTLISLTEIFTRGGLQNTEGTLFAAPSFATQTQLRQMAVQEGHTVLDFPSGPNFSLTSFGQPGQLMDTSTLGNVYINTGTEGVILDDLRVEHAQMEYAYSENNGGGFPGGGIGPGDDSISAQTTWQSGIFNIEGGDDIFVGGSGDDTLKGRSGYDWLDGGAGNDVLLGGTEDDVLLGRDGADDLRGEEGDDYLAGGSGNDTLSGGAGNDRLVAGGGADTLDGGDGDDTIYFDIGDVDSSNLDTFNGGAGSDTLSFARVEQNGWSSQAIDGGGLSNLDGVEIKLTDGNVWNGSHSSANRVASFTSIENLEGSQFDDKLSAEGHGGIHRLSGLGGQDVLLGGAQNDVLEGGKGADQLFGGEGADTASYHYSENAVWVDWTAGEAIGGDAEGDVFSSIENLEGSLYSDTLKGDINRNDVFGLHGDDWIVATSGNDHYDGGEDFDTIDYSEYVSSVTVNLGTGLGAGAATGHSYSNIEQIVGSDFADTLTGSIGDNVIQGGKGDDTINGGSGLDTYIYNRGDGFDTITEYSSTGGQDTILFGDGIVWNDLWIGTQDLNGNGSPELDIRINGTDSGRVLVNNNWNAGAHYTGLIDTIDVGGVGGIDIRQTNWADGGNANDDTVTGRGDRHNLLMAYAGNDTVYAGGTGWSDHDNIVWAGRGNDTIIASVGDDQYLFNLGDGVDTISDTGGVNSIQFGSQVEANDIIFEIVGSTLYIGIRDTENPYKTASQVADRMEIQNVRNAHKYWDNSNPDEPNEVTVAADLVVDHVSVGGTQFDLNKLDLWSQARTILIDGNSSDWGGEEYRLDGPGEGVDEVALYGKYDNGQYVFGVKTDSVAIGAFSTIWLNTDQTVATGRTLFWGLEEDVIVGADYGIEVSADGTVGLYRYESRSDSGTFISNLSHSYSDDGLYLEIAVSSDLLDGDTDGIDVFADVNDLYYVSNDYWNVPLTVEGAQDAPATPPPANNGISIDGDLSEWAGDIHRLDGEGQGEDDSAFHGVKQNGVYYFALTAPDNVTVGDGTTIWFNTDQTLNTGYKVWDFTVGAEFYANLNAQGQLELFEHVSDSGTPDDNSDDVFESRGTVDSVVNGNVLEFAISDAQLGSPGDIDVYSDINDSIYISNDYSTIPLTVLDQEQSAPTDAKNIDGILDNDWVESERLDTETGASVENFKVYGYADGNSYVFALEIGDDPRSIGAGTTIWLNTDGDSENNYLIWEFAAGAEFKIEVGSNDTVSLYQVGVDDGVGTLVADGVAEYSFGAGNKTLEVRIDASLIGSPNKVDAYVDINDEVFISPDYSNYPLTVEVQANANVSVGDAVLDGNLHEWGEGNRIDKAAPNGDVSVVDHAIYGATTGGSYVFAVSSTLDLTSGGTTFWLNTDQDVNTGRNQFWDIAQNIVGGDFSVEVSSGGAVKLLSHADSASEGVFVANLDSKFNGDGTILEFAVDASLLADGGTLQSVGNIDVFTDLNDYVYISGDYSNDAMTMANGTEITNGFTAPIVIDLDGDGADLVSIRHSRVIFESVDGGPLLRSGWVGADDGFLALDRDGDGIINKLSEISFTGDVLGATTDLEGLRAFDTNSDGVFDASDDDWANFRIWQDANQNGVGTQSELMSLDEAGIASIDLGLTALRDSTRGYQDSITLNKATVTKTDGSEMDAFDVALHVQHAHVRGSVTRPIDSAEEGAFGVAHVAEGHDGDENNTAALQTIHADSLSDRSVLPDQNIVRYVDADDSMTAPPLPTLDPNAPQTPTYGVTPLVIDLDGDGLELINPGQSPMQFDGDGDGALDRMGWISTDDAFLALDRNGDGAIQSPTEISFVDDLAGATTDLEGLRAYDSNGDGWLDSSDLRFADFQVWQDKDFNGQSSDGELSSLSEVGIDRIGLYSAEGTEKIGGNLENTVFGEAPIIWSDGTQGIMGDVELRAFKGNLAEQLFDEARRQERLEGVHEGEWDGGMSLEDRRSAFQEFIASQRDDAFRGDVASISQDGFAPSFSGYNARRVVNDDLVAKGPSQSPAKRHGGDSVGPRANIARSDTFSTADTHNRALADIDTAFDRSHSVLGSGLPDNRWWVDGEALEVAGNTTTMSLKDRLERFDVEREQGAGAPQASGLPAQDAGDLADRQRFLQAMASFKGASGIATPRRLSDYTSEDATLSSGSLRGRGGEFNRYVR